MQNKKSMSTETGLGIKKKLSCCACVKYKS